MKPFEMPDLFFIPIAAEDIITSSLPCTTELPPIVIPTNPSVSNSWLW